MDVTVVEGTADDKNVTFQVFVRMNKQEAAELQKQRDTYVEIKKAAVSGVIEYFMNWS